MRVKKTAITTPAVAGNRQQTQSKGRVRYHGERKNQSHFQKQKAGGEHSQDSPDALKFLVSANQHTDSARLSNSTPVMYNCRGSSSFHMRAQRKPQMAATKTYMKIMVM